jgi:dTDP-4-dehydrorhamnose reductase
MKKIAIIGANGQLGTELVNQFTLQGLDVVGLTHEDVEISDIDQLKKVLSSVKADIVVNTSAYHNVPLCEENPDISFKVNGIGALNLAKLSNDLHYKLVHYSTDYVFDGKKGEPYIETDQPNPLNIYALTKLDGETLIRNYCDNYFILRISGIYGKTVCRAKGGNFINTMQKAARERDVVKVVRDEILTPTSVEEIAKSTYSLMQTDAYDLYHMTCNGQCSWYEFAEVIFRELKLATPLKSCLVSDFPMTVKRPTYSVLENSNLKKINLDNMLHWEEALLKFLSENLK